MTRTVRVRVAASSCAISCRLRSRARKIRRRIGRAADFRWCIGVDEFDPPLLILVERIEDPPPDDRLSLGLIHTLERRGYDEGEDLIEVAPSGRNLRLEDVAL